MNLKYLFTAKFVDGKEIVQTENDVSTRFPGRSAFTDVLEELKFGNELVSFSLSDGNGNNHTLFMNDGSFRLNELLVNAVELPSKVQNRRLIYFRRNTLIFDPGNLSSSDRSVIYLLGWQGNDEHGRNLQQVVEIN